MQEKKRNKERKERKKRETKNGDPERKNNEKSQ